MGIIKHKLIYSIYSSKVSWCPICHSHFYNEKNEKQTTMHGDNDYHFLKPKQKRPGRTPGSFVNVAKKEPTKVMRIPVSKIPAVSMLIKKP